MSNTIKLKRGSGSDPSASDLVVGEVALRTDNGKLFTKKDNGTVAEISGGGAGLDDGDKGDITVSNGGDTFTIDNGVVTSAKIADGTIVNADISALANIDGSKIQAAGLINSGVMTAAQNNKLAGIEDNATADMTALEILSIISGENIILGTVSSTGNSTFAGNVTLSSSDGGSAAAPELDLYRVSASPADADYLGQIKFSGESDDDSKQVYAKITGKIGDASSGTEDGIIEIAHRKNGSNNISARFTSTDLKLINGTGLEVAGGSTLLGNGGASVLWGDTSSLGQLSFTATDGNPIVRAVTGKSLVFKVDMNTTAMTLDSNGNTSVNALTINSTTPVLSFQESDGNPDYRQYVEGGAFHIEDITNSNAVRLKINTDGHIDITAGLDVTSGGLDVTGNITTTSGNLTVDGTGSVEDVFKISDSAGGQRLLMGNRDSLGTDCPRIFNVGNAALTIGIGDSWSGDGGTLTSQFTIAKNGTITSVGNHDFSAGIDVTGSISVTGTVDGVDIAARDTLFGGLTSSSGVLTNGVTATTQSASDNSTKVATTAYTDTAIANLVDSAPGTLNTLNELAAALGDDANFSTTVTNSIATKMPLAGGEFTGNITTHDVIPDSNAFRNIGTSSVKFNQVHATTFHGSGANLTNLPSQTDNNFTDADHSKLDGIESGATADQTNSEIKTAYEANSNTNAFTDALLSKLNGIAASATNVTNNNQLTNGAGYVTSSGNTIIGTDSDINTSGATVIDQLNMTDGVIQSHSTRTLTLADLGYTGATNANNITNNNQLTNGAGYLTSVSSGNINNGAVTNDKIDEYEEGTWEPTLRGGSNSAGGYSIRAGSYTRIGRIVVLNFAIAITSKSSMSGDLHVVGMPSQVAVTGNILGGTSIEGSGICGFWSNVSPNSSHITLVADQSNGIFLRHTVGAEDNPDQMQASDIDSDFTVRGTITYFTDA